MNDLNFKHLNFDRSVFSKLYGTNESILEAQRARYSAAAQKWVERFGEPEKLAGSSGQNLRFFSSPGRSEIGGNHTDHNLGKVLAASIRQDVIGAVQKTDDNIIHLYDLTYAEDYHIDTQKSERIPDEKGSAALVRGIVQGFKNKGYKTGGFKACFTSDVIAAAGLSSSASFEMIICLILNNLFNDGKIGVQQFAEIGQFAENRYWDKASGLLDQTACAVGGLIAIDFKNPAQPLIEQIPFDFEKQAYDLIIVNTGKSHADLSKEYSAIPEEMKAVARILGKEHLRDVSFADVVSNLAGIRTKCCDRGVLRAFHFFEENERVDKEVAALKADDFKTFLQLITQSGNSSWKWLQNVYVPGQPDEQSIAVCLALTEHFIGQKGEGACRIHGGGFAGVIQVFMPQRLSREYTSYMENALEKSADESPVYRMSIRPLGAVEVPLV